MKKLVNGKVKSIWRSPSEKWQRKYCYYFKRVEITSRFAPKDYKVWDEEEFQENLKLTYSIVLECGSCSKELWLPITTPQLNGEEIIKCIICKQENILIGGTERSKEL